MIASFLGGLRIINQALLLSFCLAVSGVQAATVAGQVEWVEGEVKIVDAEGNTRLPQVGDKIFEGDLLHSGRQGELHLRMQDEGLIALRENTQLKIETYQATGVDSDSAVLSLLKGTFRSITGWIGKLNRKNYKVQTLNATLGIRGTDHEPLYVPESDALEHETNPPGTYDKVNSGGTVIESAFGVIEVAPDQVGYAPLRGAPRLLPKAPVIYLRGKQERRIEERKEGLQRNIDEKIQNRRKNSANGAGEARDGGSPPDIKNHRERRPPRPPPPSKP